MKRDDSTNVSFTTKKNALHNIGNLRWLFDEGKKLDDAVTDAEKDEAIEAIADRFSLNEYPIDGEDCSHD